MSKIHALHWMSLRFYTWLLLFIWSVLSDFLQPHGLQHARLPCPSLSLRVGSNSCPLSPGDVIQPSCLLSSPSPPTLNLFQHQGLFQWVGSSHRWPKFLNFSFSISLSNEYSRLSPFRIDWSDLLVVQGTLKSLLQHHSSKHQIRRSVFFIVQLSYPYMTTGKTIALTR